MAFSWSPLPIPIPEDKTRSPRKGRQAPALKEPLGPAPPAPAALSMLELASLCRGFLFLEGAGRWFREERTYCADNRTRRAALESQQPRRAKAVKRRHAP